MAFHAQGQIFNTPWNQLRIEWCDMSSFHLKGKLTSSPVFQWYYDDNSYITIVISYIGCGKKNKRPLFNNQTIQISIKS
jgi:hypothetical protein